MTVSWRRMRYNIPVVERSSEGFKWEDLFSGFYASVHLLEVSSSLILNPFLLFNVLCRIV